MRYRERLNRINAMKRKSREHEICLCDICWRYRSERWYIRIHKATVHKIPLETKNS